MIIKTDFDKGRMLFSSSITDREVNGKALYDTETHELIGMYFEVTEEEAELYQAAGGQVLDTYADWNEWRQAV